MKKLFLMVTAAFLTIAAYGGNLIDNADFKQIKNDTAVSWVKIGQGNITFNSETACVRLASPDNGTAACSVRQSVFKKLQKGKKYLLSCKVRGDKFVRIGNADYGMMIINRSWKGSVGTRRFQVADNQWRTIKKVIVIPENWTDAIVVLFMTGGKGALEFTDLSLTEVK